MRGLKGFIAGMALSASFLMASTAQAMPIPQFDKLPGNQRAEFTLYLIQSATDLLKAQGNTADAAKITSLFELTAAKTSSPTMVQFVQNLNGVRILNQQHANDPNFKPFEVEHALSLTLKQNGIVVPVSKLLLASQTYKPGAPSGTLTAQTGAPAPRPGGQ